MIDGKFKAGEIEAKTILENKGYIFNDSYHDDNSSGSMPDFQFENGIFLEITHTKHDNYGWYSPSLAKMSIDERMEESNEATKAYERLQRDEYAKDENSSYTDEGQKTRKKDVELVKKYRGFDFDKNTISEFGSKLMGTPISINNILEEILKDKGAKYKDGNVELFIFITQDEEHSLIANKDEFLFKAKHSPFKTVYLCVWDIDHNQYDLENPILYKADLINESSTLELL